MASGETIEFIEEKYDELISLIKCGNSKARVYLCSVAPRKDADVLATNRCITDWVIIGNHNKCMLYHTTTTSSTKTAM